MRLGRYLKKFVPVPSLSITPKRNVHPCVKSLQPFLIVFHNLMPKSSLLCCHHPPTYSLAITLFHEQSHSAENLQSHVSSRDLLRASRFLMLKLTECFSKQTVDHLAHPVNYLMFYYYIFSCMGSMNFQTISKVELILGIVENYFRDSLVLCFFVLQIDVTYNLCCFANNVML